MLEDGDLFAVDKHVAKKFDVGVKLGKGAYGVVWQATDRKSQETVALKKIYDAFQNATDAQRTFREVIYLQQMGGHENIVQLRRVLKADNDRDRALATAPRSPRPSFMTTAMHCRGLASTAEPPLAISPA